MSTSISTYATWFAQTNTNNYLNAQVSVLEQETSSGQYANQATQLGPQNSLVYQLQTEYSQQNAVTTAATNAGYRVSAMQTSMSAIASALNSMSTQAISVTGNGATTQAYQAVSSDATGTINQLLQQLNATYGGQFVFSGQDSGTATMVASVSATTNSPSSVLSTMLSNAVSSNGGPLTSASVSSLESTLNGMFADTSGSSATNFSGVFFTATDNGNPVSVSVGGSQTLSYNLKGNSQGFRDTFEALSMLSMLNAPSSQLDDTAKQQLAANASNLLNKGQSELTTQTANLGAQQAQLSTIAGAQQTAASNTQLQIAGFTEVNETTLATQLEATKTQLEASYEITSQISSLSFVNYMK